MSACACGCGATPGGRRKKWATDACYAVHRLRADMATRAERLPVSKPCACGCGRIVTSRRTSRRFFSAQCGKNHWGRLPKSEREAHRAQKAARHPNTALIHEARAETPRGECIYCPERTSSPRAYTCGSAECRSEYQRDYGATRRARAKEAHGRRDVLCRCGCGHRFIPARGRVYVNNEHWLAARRKKRALRHATKKTGPRAHGPGITFGKRTEPKVIRPFWRAG